jgi:hypothetical protein
MNLVKEKTIFYVKTSALSIKRLQFQIGAAWVIDG